jgi:chromosome segregation ATPase
MHDVDLLLCRTLNTAWVQIKEETDSIAKKHAELAEALDTQVATPISNTIKEYKKKREKLKLDGRKLIKDLGEAEKKKDTAKTTYDSARRALDDAKEKYEQATHNNAQTPQIDKVCCCVYFTLFVAAMLLLLLDG